MPGNQADGYIYIDLQLRQDEFEKRLAQVEGKTSSFASKIKKTLLAIGIGAMAKKAAGYIYDVGASFEAAMSRVQAISGATGKELEMLTEKAKELGASTKYSAPEVAEAMTEMAKAGWSAQQIIDGMSGVLDAAAASGEGLATTSTIVADAITGFGLAAKDSTHVADLLTQAANAGTIDISDLGETFKYIAPVARAMGLSIEDVTTAISAMSMAGIKGSQAGTSLRTVLTRMVKPTDAVAEAMDELGIVLTNQDGSFKSLDQIVAEMRGSFSKLTDEQKTYYAAILAGQEGMLGLLAMLNLSQEEYDAIAKSMDNCNGVAQQTASIMQDNLASAVEQLGGGLETIAISIYEKVAPSLTEFVNYITNNVLPVIDDFINNIDEWWPVVNNAIAVITGLAAAFGTLKTAMAIKDGLKNVKSTFDIFNSLKSVGFGNITSFLGVLEKGSGGLAKLASSAISAGGGIKGLGSALMAAAGGPVTLIVAGIAAVVAAFVYLWNTSEEFRNFWINLWNKVKEVASDVIDSIVQFFTKTIPKAYENLRAKLQSIGKSISDFFKNIWNGIISFFTETVPSAFSNVCNQISQLFVNLWNDIVSFFTETIPGWIENVIAWFNKLPYELGYMVGQMLGHLIQWGIDLKNFVTVDIPAFINSIVEWFSQLPGKIQEKLLIAWNNIVQWGTNTYQSASEWISKTISSIVEWFSSLPGKIWTWLVNAYNKVVTWGTNTVNAGKQKASAFINSVINYISQLPSKIWSWFSKTISNVVKFGSDMVSKGKSAASNLVNSIVNTVKSLPGKMFSIGSDMVKGIWNGIASVRDWILGKIGGFCDGVVDGIKDFFGIHSPSRVMADMVGKFLPPGIAVGFEMAMPKANKDILKSTQGLVDGFQTEVNMSVNKNHSTGDYDPKPSGNGGGFFDYDRFGNAVAIALSSMGLTVKVNNRELGRIIQEV